MNVVVNPTDFNGGAFQISNRTSQIVMHFMTPSRGEIWSSLLCCIDNVIQKFGVGHNILACWKVKKRMDSIVEHCKWKSLKAAVALRAPNYFCAFRGLRKKRSTHGYIVPPFGLERGEICLAWSSR
ncbi:MAG: hypothetical protein ABIP75_15055 [Pyrinomonadaceae bacterium]